MAIRSTTRPYIKRFRKYVQMLEAKIAIITIGLFPYSINSSTPPPYYHAAFIPCTPNDFPKTPKKGCDLIKWARQDSDLRPSDYESGGAYSIASTPLYHPHIWRCICTLPYQIWGLAFIGAFRDWFLLQPYCKSFSSGFMISSIFSAAASWEWAITCP